MAGQRKHQQEAVSNLAASAAQANTAEAGGALQPAADDV
jgi:hypothetical protein